ncbi:MAG TPA: hypothetical protein VMJ10_18575 [Kofleriaceae bacterium]|nr:hypothetical protein [Kofleriaceae bacterium]
MDDVNVYVTNEGNVGMWPKAGGVQVTTQWPAPLPGSGVPATVTGGTLYYGQDSAVIAVDLTSGLQRSIDVMAQALAPAPSGGVFLATGSEIDLVPAGFSTVQPIATTTGTIADIASSGDALFWIEYPNASSPSYLVREFQPSTAITTTLVSETPTGGVPLLLYASATELLDVAPYTGRFERRSIDDGSLIESIAGGLEATAIAESSRFIYSAGRTSMPIGPGGACYSTVGLDVVDRASGSAVGSDITGHDSRLVVDDDRVYYTSEPTSSGCVSAMNGGDVSSTGGPYLMCFLE